MDRDVKFVVVRTSRFHSMLNWLSENVPEEHLPVITRLENRKRDKADIVKARFANDHYASLFRMFWDEGT